MERSRTLELRQRAEVRSVFVINNFVWTKTCRDYYLAKTPGEEPRLCVIMGKNNNTGNISFFSSLLPCANIGLFPTIVFLLKFF